MVKKYLKIWWRVVRMSVMQAMMYKLDFVFGYTGVAAFLLTQFLLIWFMFESGQIDSLAGYSKYDFYLVFCGSEVVTFVLFGLVYENVRLVREQIYRGRIDAMMLKPNNLAFLLMFQKIGLDDLVVAVVYLAITLIFYNYLHGLNWFIFLQISWVLLISIFVSGTILWISGIVWFYWPKFLGLWWFYNNMSEISRYPRKLYPELLQIFLMYLIPVFMVTNPLFDVIDGYRMSYIFLDQFLVALVLIILLMIMWKDGLNRYESVT